MSARPDNNLRYLKAEYQNLMEERTALREERAALSKALMACREETRRCRVEMLGLWKTLREHKGGKPADFPFPV